MVTTTVRMLNRVHGDTTHLRPAVALNLVFVVGAACLQDGFVDTATTGNNSYDKTIVSKKIITKNIIKRAKVIRKSLYVIITAVRNR